jgi:hypothetical protein
MTFTDSIKNYNDYLKCIKNWYVYSAQEQEQLKKWYRNYYSENKETERQRYRNYYAVNTDKEKERVKSIRNNEMTRKKIEF